MHLPVSNHQVGMCRLPAVQPPKQLSFVEFGEYHVGGFPKESLLDEELIKAHIVL